ncbi:hypothetical protein L3X38_028344 [Prunus dulcis]|uniref:Secreted protein n=1 Tax=Prunus dulcis TaxID=3755 RepID=A0AAD4VRK1_PRUDU|nr:hypothetical protein L3X38_028344 [Prunus dulcis]
MAGTPFLFGWKVLLWAGLDAPGPVRTCFVTSDARLTYKSIPKFDFWQSFMFTSRFVRPLNGQNCSFFSLKGTEVAILEGLMG